MDTRLTRALQQVESLPSLPLPTLGGRQLWGDVFLHAGYRIQQSVVTRHHRLLGPADVRLAAGSYAHCYATFERLVEQRRVEPVSDHLVLALHGFFRSKEVFSPMVRALREAGYEAHGVNYPSTRQGLADHADQVEQLLERATGVSTVSFVTHSMGGIVARVLLSRSDRPWRRRIAVNRLVMIATPNQGAEMAARLHQIAPFRAVAGPSLGEIRPEERAAIPVPDVRFGIVAASRGDGHGYNPLLPGDDDMTVSVESTRLEGAEDFLVVKGIHTFVMVQPDVIEATIRYLRTGRFAE